jgi:hypothetical protein
MSDSVPYLPSGEVAASVRELLEVFHEDTAHKLAIAPSDSLPIVHGSDGMFCAVGEDGWPEVYDDLDEPEAFPVCPLSVHDTETD